MGGSRRGVDMGPSAFRIAGLRRTDSRRSAASSSIGRSCVAHSREQRSTAIPGRSSSGRSPRCAIASIRPARASIEEGAIPLVLGGDHSLGAGSVAASAAHRAGVTKPLGLCGLTRTAT
jgi:arginase